jgi:hypothetical protein
VPSLIHTGCFAAQQVQLREISRFPQYGGKLFILILVSRVYRRDHDSDEFAEFSRSPAEFAKSGAAS